MRFEAINQKNKKKICDNSLNVILDQIAGEEFDWEVYEDGKDIEFGPPVGSSKRPAVHGPYESLEETVSNILNEDSAELHVTSENIEDSISILYRKYEKFHRGILTADSPQTERNLLSSMDKM